MEHRDVYNIQLSICPPALREAELKRIEGEIRAATKALSNVIATTSVEQERIVVRVRLDTLRILQVLREVAGPACFVFEVLPPVDDASSVLQEPVHTRPGDSGILLIDPADSGVYLESPLADNQAVLGGEDDFVLRPLDEGEETGDAENQIVVLGGYDETDPSLGEGALLRDGGTLLTDPAAMHESVAPVEQLPFWGRTILPEVRTKDPRTYKVTIPDKFEDPELQPLVWGNPDLAVPPHNPQLVGLFTRELIAGAEDDISPASTIEERLEEQKDPTNPI